MGPQTIFSIAPYPLFVEMPGRSPAIFFLEASKGDPVSRVIGDGSSTYYMDADRGSLMVLTPSDTFVEEIVRSTRDTALLAMEGAGQPGIFSAPGRWSWPEDAAKVVLRYEENGEEKTKTLRQMMDEATRNQVEWFKKLVRLADNLWNHPNGKRPNQISDLQRLAAKRLGVVKEWVDKDIIVEAIRCKFCTSVLDGEAIVCPICRNILNQAAYKALTTEEKDDVPKPEPSKPGSLSAPRPGA